METFPEADVIWWNANSYYAWCPFCEGNPLPQCGLERGKIENSPCERMEHYLCCFPYNDQGEVAQEIDKRRGRYINICVSLECDIKDCDRDDVNKLADELARKAT